MSEPQLTRFIDFSEPQIQVTDHDAARRQIDFSHITGFRGKMTFRTDTCTAQSDRIAQVAESLTVRLALI